MSKNTTATTSSTERPAPTARTNGPKTKAPANPAGAVAKALAAQKRPDSHPATFHPPQPLLDYGRPRPSTTGTETTMDPELRGLAVDLGAIFLATALMKLLQPVEPVAHPDLIVLEGKRRTSLAVERMTR